jgi:hypothetical protein
VLLLPAEQAKLVRSPIAVLAIPLQPANAALMLRLLLLPLLQLHYCGWPARAQPAASVAAAAATLGALLGLGQRLELCAADGTA